MSQSLMSQSLQQRKESAVEKLMSFNGVRRGQLSEQYYRRKNKADMPNMLPPYFVVSIKSSCLCKHSIKPMLSESTNSDANKRNLDIKTFSPVVIVMIVECKKTEKLKKNRRFKPGDKNKNRVDSG